MPDDPELITTAADDPGPARVLVVDDTHLNRVVLQRDLEAAGHHVHLAASGEEAIEALRDHGPFDLIILDIVLPSLSGIEVLRWVRKRWSPVELPVIMASGRRGAEDVVEALDEGANDYIVKPLNMTVVMARVRVQLLVHRLDQSLQERNRDLVKAQELLQSDLDAAARIQASLLPERMPENSSCWFHCYYHPCSTIGGDVYNVIQLDEHHRAVYLIDVSGHGVPAALLAVSLSHLLSGAAESSPLVDRSYNGRVVVPPHEVAQRLNQRFQITRANLQYFTMLYGVLDERAGTFTYVQAGHPPPICLRADGSVDALEQHSLPIGMMPKADYEDTCLRLHAGDRLFIYSDGLTEAENSAGDQYTFQRLSMRLQRGRRLGLGQTVNAVAGDVSRWCEGIAQRDDYSMVALEMKS